MRLGLPFDGLHEAMSSATHRDLPEITYEDRDWDAYRGMTASAQLAAMRNNAVPTVTKTRRVYGDELEVVMFPQTWGSTALGYGGLGGSAMTGAYTIVITYHNYVCVYFGCGRLAYSLDYSKMSPEGRENFHSDLQAHTMAAVAQSGKYQ